MDTEDFEAEDSHLVKDLRKQLNDANKRAKQFEEELTGLRTQFRERSVAEVLTAKGINPKVAKFLPADVDGEDAINSWLEENGDVFGGVTVQDSQGSGVSDEAKAQLSKANALTERAVSAGNVADFEQRIANAGSVDELNGILAEYQKFQL